VAAGNGSRASAGAAVSAPLSRLEDGSGVLECEDGLEFGIVAVFWDGGGCEGGVGPALNGAGEGLVVAGAGGEADPASESLASNRQAASISSLFSR